VGPALVTPIARLFGLKVVVTHHGPDYDRDKWGAVARWILRAGESAGMRCSNARIAISRVIVNLIQTKYECNADLIPNGVFVRDPGAGLDYIKSVGLLPGQYFLQVGRIVPEKRQLDLIRAYRALQPAAWKLVIVGGLSPDAYSHQVQAEAASAGIVLTGFQKGSELHELYSHAGAFVLPSSHEGLPIALLEALSYGLPVLASNIPANLEVGLESSSYFPVGDLRALSAGLQRVSQQAHDDESRLARRRIVANRYNWDVIADSTLKVYARVAGLGSA
jgi:glycosyltransferase involved in cell wall biosynthesis